MKPKHIDVRIGKLVLDGFAPGARHAIGAATERELAHILRERGLSPALAGRQKITLPNKLTAQANPDNIGTQVAQAIYRGIGRR